MSDKPESMFGDPGQGSAPHVPGMPPKPKEAPQELLDSVQAQMDNAATQRPTGQAGAFIAEGAELTAEQKEAAAKENSVFQNRGEVEASIVNQPMQRVVTLEGKWDGKNEITVPKWMAWHYFELSEEIARIILTLFPNNYFFLFYIDHSQIASATAQVQDILFNKVGQQMTSIILNTCEIPEERRIEFLKSVTGWDLVEIFLCIIEMNINNDSMRALQKKFKRLLGERFALENVFPDWEDITAGHRSTAPEASLTNNSLSFISMQ